MSDFLSNFPFTIGLLKLMGILLIILGFGGLSILLIFFYAFLMDKIVKYDDLLFSFCLIINSLFLATCVDIYSSLIPNGLMDLSTVGKEFKNHAILYSLYLPVGLFVIIPSILSAITFFINRLMKLKVAKK